MTYIYCSHNNQLIPKDQANVSLDDIAYSYGFGVYETLRISKGQARWSDEHLQRLMHSAQTIGLEHNFTPDQIQYSLDELIQANEAQDANAKILLIGGRTAADANLYIHLLNPLYPDRKLYKTGVHTITVNYERLWPQAKTLNMLPSYLAYRQAQAAGAYDALLVNAKGEITEGTRTNFLALRGKTIYTPPESQILLGVMRAHVLKAAVANGFTIQEEPIPLHQIQSYDTAFLTSTSTKIIPIKTINEYRYEDTTGPQQLMHSLVLD